MSNRNLSILTAILFALSFGLFVMGYEKHALIQAQTRIETHARIIEDAMWNYNHLGASEYMALAADTDGYESLTATHHSGDIFQEIRPENAKSFEKLLVRLGLIPRVPLMARVEYRGNVIGWVEAVWLPRSIYVYTYVFFAALLFYSVIFLYLRVLKAKHVLEDRVEERTAELVDSNRALKREIEERISAEVALRASEEKYRLMAANINDVIWTMDLEMNYTYISPAATKMHGWSFDEIEALTLDQVLDASSIEMVANLLMDHIAKAEKIDRYNPTLTMELNLFRKDGTKFPTEVTVSFILSEKGHPVGIMGVTRDISERKKTEKEKRELRTQLERSKKMESLGLLAGGVAHDLNNVLSGIVSYPDMLLMDMPAESPLRAPIETMKESGQKAATIVQDLLTLARRGVIAQDVLNLNEIIDTYRTSPEHQKIMAQHPNTRIDFRLEPNLFNIKGSSVHLKKTLMNLIANAAEAQPAGGRIEITTESRFLDYPIRGYNTVNEGEYIFLRVKDSGEGISAEDLNHIFEPFYTKKKMGRSGTGLGLAVVWGTVQDHHGYIDVTSTKGDGTTFDLYFPLSREMVTEKASGLDFEAIRGKGETLLVVDDMESQRKIAAHLLGHLDYRVHTAESGEAAVQFLKNNTVALVILDMLMGTGMDGLETYREILKLHPGQKAIIASGFAETARVKEAQRIGAGTYIKKPYIISTLGNAIKEELRT
jgi:two-component system, cell cycle sensor histidine kinase and response regulator CckA